MPFWLDSNAAPAKQPGLEGERTCDLAIIGGGFTGLWSALHAIGDQPGRDVVLLEGERVGWGASGRNGGFADASLTHGLPNGLARFPDEIDALERIGNENLAGMERDLARHGIECAWESPGYLTVARTDNEVDELRQFAAATGRSGWIRPPSAHSSIRPATAVRSGSTAALRWSIPAGWHGACEPSASTGACACTRARR